MNSKYIGNMAWGHLDEMLRDFGVNRKKEIYPKSDDDIVVAYYDGGGYDGSAYVLFKHEGKLYEVLGSHCSCDGLGDQWSPDEVSVEQLKMRNEGTYDRDAWNYPYQGEGKELIEAFINE